MDSSREGYALHARSAITNGVRFLPSVDGRSLWARRARDLMELHLSDLGGEEHVSEALRSICRRCAVIETELEYQEMAFAEARAAGREPKVSRLDLYNRLAGNLRRLLESIGLQRRARAIGDAGERGALEHLLTPEQADEFLGPVIPTAATRRAATRERTKKAARRRTR